MYSSLVDAPVNTDLTLLEVTNPSLERWLQRMGLFVGARVTRLGEDFNFHPVRVSGSRGDVIVPAGLAMKIYVHLASGEKIPLTEMERNHEGHVEIHSGGRFVDDHMTRLGLAEDQPIRFIRSLPHMDYVTLINRRERTRLSEGEAARIWGHYPGEEISQFYFAKKGLDFTVSEVMGGPKAVRHLKTHGVSPGVVLTMETIEQAKSLHSHEPTSAPIIISSAEGLRLYLNTEKAGAIIVRAE